MKVGGADEGWITKEDNGTMVLDPTVTINMFDIRTFSELMGSYPRDTERKECYQTQRIERHGLH